MRTGTSFKTNKLHKILQHFKASNEPEFFTLLNVYGALSLGSTYTVINSHSIRPRYSTPPICTAPVPASGNRPYTELGRRDAGAFLIISASPLPASHTWLAPHPFSSAPHQHLKDSWVGGSPWRTCAYTYPSISALL
ncbi:hypothetical protein B0H13DRAFT_2349330 [Mycena leptocephala]|nr:hypothetical protein B0H13DRAFT_2349330 [Mycena leptocephala]